MSKKGRLLFTLSILSFLSLIGLFFAIRVWMPFMWFVLAPAVICLLAWLFVDRKILIDFFTLKTTKQGLNMGVIILLTLVVLTAINFVGARHYKTFDFSNNGVNSISEQSIKILSSLEEDLIVKYFYKNGAERSEENKRLFRELVKHYQDVTSKVKLELVEINEKPKLVKEFGANRGSGEAFIQYKGSKNRIENFEEQDFTNAVIKATRKDKKNIYFLEGHGERSIDDEKSDLSLYGFRQLLEKNSYSVQKLNLIKQGMKVPDDAHVVVIAGPTHVISSSEIQVLEQYLMAGGNLLMMVDDKETYGLSPIFKKLGIEIEPFYVYNVFQTPMGKVVNAQAATVAVQYSSINEITRLFNSNQMSLFRNPVSLKLKEKDPLVDSEIIIQTPEKSAALLETDSKDYTGDLRQFNLAIASKGKLSENSKEFSTVVFSDVDFVSNILLYQNINRDVALNAIASLAKETDLISISAKEPTASKMLVSPPEFAQFFKFTVVFIFLPIPFVFIIISLVLWYRRRHA